MIGAILLFGADVVEVRVDNSSVYFRTVQNPQFVDIKGLSLDKAGTIKEFPDLESNPDWRAIAIERFRDKIKKMKNEEERIKYVIDDLTKFGYKAKFIQKAGFRKIKL